jgi:hypothetical protein
MPGKDCSLSPFHATYNPTFCFPPHGTRHNDRMAAAAGVACPLEAPSAIPPDPRRAAAPGRWGVHFCELSCVCRLVRLFVRLFLRSFGRGVLCCVWGGGTRFESACSLTSESAPRCK